MSDSINEQRCEHGKTADDAHERNGDTCFHPFECFDRCPGPSVVTPPAQDEQRPWCSYCGGAHLIEACPDYNTDEGEPGTEDSPAVPSVSTDHTDEKHCETCHCGRRAPVQRSVRLNKPAGSISWAEHLKAWEPYGARYSQSAERIAERGGFSYGELVDQLGYEPTTWLPIGAGRG